MIITHTVAVHLRCWHLSSAVPKPYCHLIPKDNCSGIISCHMGQSWSCQQCASHQHIPQNLGKWRDHWAPSKTLPTNRAQKHDCCCELSASSTVSDHLSLWRSISSFKTQEPSKLGTNLSVKPITEECPSIVTLLASLLLYCWWGVLSVTSLSSQFVSPWHCSSLAVHLPSLSCLAHRY
jgi:hypothetical protein